ncbi:hypothetical protein FHS42_003828 [Streptomyces zagrosensis]|uniref:Uncharacterized protein n=1 Tax=Streptomyces zagrosensis TaxID=1042984 RepID=A0A7W9UZX1_9ACTN|nr:hypothetical protein [Streptomyces zagrosensis]
MTLGTALRTRLEWGNGGRQVPVGSAQYGGARRRASPGLRHGEPQREMGGGGANWENLL